MVYHGLCQKDHTRFNPIFLTCKMFESHLQFYKKYFHVISLDDFLEQKFLPGRFNVCLTFDDGFANNFSCVLPLLEQYRLPATFFITGIREAGYDILWNDFLNMVTHYGPLTIAYKGSLYIKNRSGRYVSQADGKALADLLRAGDFSAKEEMMKVFASLDGFRKSEKDAIYWQQMTEDQIRQLSLSPLITIGSHGYYHNDLARVARDQAREEMVLSKKYLEGIIGREVKALAFPYGSYTPEVVEDAKQAGYSQLLATELLLNVGGHDRTLAGRLTINPFIQVHSQMQAIIKGYYEGW